MKKEYISQATLKRLPQYLRIIKEKKNENVKNISSTEIATILRLNPIQVRKDLALVSRVDGKPGVGFNGEELIQDLEEVLNLNNITDAVIVGAGKLGQALLNYKGFENNLNILMAFDNDKIKCDNKKIFFIDDMENLINKNNIQNCFERILLISASSIEKEKKYPVKINIELGKVTISCANQTGDAKEEIYVDTEGKDLEVGFNPRFFLDALKAIDDEDVYIEFGTNRSPCIIKPVEDGDYVYMILPIKMKD